MTWPRCAIAIYKTDWGNWLQFFIYRVKTSSFHLKITQILGLAKVSHNEWESLLYSKQEKRSHFSLCSWETTAGANLATCQGWYVLSVVYCISLSEVHFNPILQKYNPFQLHSCCLLHTTHISATQTNSGGKEWRGRSPVQSCQMRWRYHDLTWTAFHGQVSMRE